MKHDLKTNNLKSKRAGERGAALVTMLLVSVLLLGAGGALIMTTTMSANNSMSSTAEMQAFYVAEAGMQSALNVLRGNTRPTITTTDRMSFRTAVVPSISNGGNSGALRLAGWLPYNDPSDPASLVPISLGTITGGYRITVEDASPNSHIVRFQTSATITGGDAATPSKKTFGTVGDKDEVTIRYSAQAATTLTFDPTTYPLTLTSNLGSFIIERPITSTKNNVSIPRTKFRITINQTLPWTGTAILDGKFEGKVDTNASSVVVTFDNAYVKADGTTFALNLGAAKTLTLAYTTSPTTTTIPIKVTAPEPKRLLLKSYGFGPQRAEKRLELLISRAFLDTETPAPVTLRGADDCTPLTFATGHSDAKVYSGVDRAGVDPQKPAFAVIPCDESETNSGIEKPETVSDPKIGIMSDDDTIANYVKTPWYLNSATDARTYLSTLKTKAESVGRYYALDSDESMTVNDSIDRPVFTFVDGDCTLAGGAGFLVVTGTLTMHGNPNFRGEILVLGEGVVIRKGGGNGDIFGAITVAAFDRTSGGFLPPTFNTSGGGNSTVQYDSAALNSGLSAGTNVSGVREF